MSDRPFDDRQPQPGCRQGAALPAPLHRAPRLLPRLVLRARARARGRRRPARSRSRSTPARTGRRSTSTARSSGSFVEQRAGWLALREDAREALAALKDEPAAGIFASAHADERVGEDEALRRTILIPLLVATAERCGGFDWDDDAFDRAYARARAARSSATGARTRRSRRSSASRPAGRSSSAAACAFGRPRASELTAAWPDAGRLLPRDWGREIDRTLVLELEAELDSQACRVPDAPAEFGRAVSALRLATPGAIAAGPVVFERLDWRPYDVRPDAGDSRPRCRRGRRPGSTSSARRSSSSCRRASPRPPTSCSRRSTGGSSRSSTWARTDPTSCARRSRPCSAATRAPGRRRCGPPCSSGETAREREELLIALRALVDGDGPGARAEDAVRRALVETLLEGSREDLVAALDEALLGLRPRPQVHSSSRVLAAG